MEGVITSAVMLGVSVTCIFALRRLKSENEVLKQTLELVESERDSLGRRVGIAVRSLHQSEREIERLRNALIAKPAPTVLSTEDIKRLISLCHPDKHGGKPMAVEMTQKLLSLRG